jgi:LysM repeat protein
MVVEGNTCDSIQRQYGISAANFNQWNPQVGATCSTLWLGYYVCVGV